ncbi:MAG: diguanylate cyclase [Gammaproteobacteria bacterium]
MRSAWSPECRGLDFTATNLRFFASTACEVIVVDDDDDVRAHLIELLESSGYRVRAAASGDEALRAVDESPCSIVLCDWEMPGMDGLALCRSIRERRLTNYIYVVLLTVRATHDDVLLGLNAGADDFVVKGTPSAELLARLSVGRRIAGLEASLRAAIEESSRLAMTDGLTGARNRRYLMTQLEHERHRCADVGASLSLLMCDLDHFKGINDDFGHAVGDEVLRGFVSRVMPVLRKGDWIARTGGEEFVVVLPHASLDAAETVAARICGAVRAEPIASSGGQVDVTVSIGAAAAKPCSSTAFARWMTCSARPIDVSTKANETDAIG